MKRLFFILSLTLLTGVFSCDKSNFEDAYKDPSKITSTTIGKQFSGVLYAANDYYMPRYGNYFVTLRVTINYYTQITGWPFITNMYIPGSAATGDIWNNYYNTLLQFRSLEDIYIKSSSEEQSENKIYFMAAKVFMYDYTQRMVDLFGSIPFTEAGKIGQNSGDYVASLAKYDSAEDIYTLMLDDLKSIASDLGTVTLNTGVASAFASQDYLNAGNINKWKIYCNSLRLRMLTRVSGASSFSSRANSEIGEILGNPSQFPIADSNQDNILIDVYDVNSPINSTQLNQTFEPTTWYLHSAGKKMIDFMNETGDPRLLTIFQPGNKANGEYNGISYDASSEDAQAMVINGIVAGYNESTFRYNEYFPAVLSNAAEVNLYKAEYYLKTGNNAAAKAAYEAAISESMDLFYDIQHRSANTLTAAPNAPSTMDKSTYLSKSGVNWDSETDKLKLIAYQKWIHYNMTQPYENWAESRRLDKLGLEFEVDSPSIQTIPPVRWVIPSDERTFNEANYLLIQSGDNLNNKIFWDVN